MGAYMNLRNLGAYMNLRNLGAYIYEFKKSVILKLSGGSLNKAILVLVIEVFFDDL